jgi:hypothetical protein
MTGMSAEREYMRDGRITKMVLIELTDDRCVNILLLYLFTVFVFEPDL